MLRVIEYFAKSLKVTQGYSKWHSWERRKSLSVVHRNFFYISHRLQISSVK